jgi:hypothetical protein
MLRRGEDHPYDYDEDAHQLPYERDVAQTGK